LSTVGFTSFVVLLAMVTFVNQESDFLIGYGVFSWLGTISIGSFDGGGALAVMLMFPLGFAYAIVAVAAQTLLNDRVPLHLQGRVNSTQNAMAAIAASAPVLAAGALSDVVGVIPVMALLAAAIGLAALMNLRPPPARSPRTAGALP
jgi:MFS family permease